MRIPIQVVAAVLFIALVSGVYTNCQQSVQFAGQSENSILASGEPDEPGGPGEPPVNLPPTTSQPPTSLPPSTPPIVPPPVVPPPPVVDIQTTCENSNHLSSVKNVRFPNPNVTCAWNQNGNLGPRDLYFQGRIEQSVTLDLPAGAKICNMAFSFPRQSFRYDDHFLFTFNDLVLASSYDFRSYLESSEGLLKYDWSRIVGIPWLTNKEGTFCASARDGQGVLRSGTCSWPSTDVAGNIQMSFPQDVFYATMNYNLTRAHHEFKFVSIGDNDTLDCEHSDIRFDLAIEYVIVP